jgi:hypothetical protein
MSSLLREVVNQVMIAPVEAGEKAFLPIQSRDKSEEKGILLFRI